jgi:hypothetical protein
MSGQMSWLAALGGNNQKILHLRENPQSPWRPYTAFAAYRVPDLTVPGASKGWTTYQKMRAAGWELMSTDQAEAQAVTTPAVTSQAI